MRVSRCGRFEGSLADYALDIAATNTHAYVAGRFLSPSLVMDSTTLTNRYADVTCPLCSDKRKRNYGTNNRQLYIHVTNPQLDVQEIFYESFRSFIMDMKTLQKGPSDPPFYLVHMLRPTASKHNLIVVICDALRS